ncbi:hypothetical protein [Desulfocicer niacini]
MEDMAMKRKREDHTITVDFKTTEAYLRIIQDGKAFIEFVVAFLVSIGVQLKHRKKPQMWKLPTFSEVISMIIKPGINSIRSITRL